MTVCGCLTCSGRHRGASCGAVGSSSAQSECWERSCRLSHSLGSNLQGGWEEGGREAGRRGREGGEGGREEREGGRRGRRHDSVRDVREFFISRVPYPLQRGYSLFKRSKHNEPGSHVDGISRYLKTEGSPC